MGEAERRCRYVRRSVGIPRKNFETCGLRGGLATYNFGRSRCSSRPQATTPLWLLDRPVHSGYAKAPQANHCAEAS
jgi:hypothetical protein